MPDTSTAAIDANVILRYVLRDDPDLSSKAKGILAEVEAGAYFVSCDPVNLAEVVFVLQSRYSVSRAEIVEGLLPIVRNDGFRLVDKDRYLLALELYAGPVKHFGDACCCAAALQQHDGRLYSFDRALSRVPGIRRSEKPFRS